MSDQANVQIQPTVVFRQGKIVRLRPMNKETDLVPCLIGMNDPEVTKFISNNEPVSSVAENKWFDDLATRANDIVLAIDRLDTGRIIGNMGLHKINRKMRTAVTGAVIFDKTCWGKGYGYEAKMLILDFAFNELDLHRIDSEVIVFNERSINYSKKCGYVVEGTKREAMYAQGKRWDVIQMGVLRKDWEPLWEEFQKRS